VETIFVLLPLALLIAAIAVGFFVWAARSGQFDDLETPAVRILFDDPPSSPPPRVSSPADEATARPARVAATGADEDSADSTQTRRVSE
jgi:cbb3-type cytochrome oxidase maturation protein